MELEFDKEINAILRKAGRQASAAQAPSAHVDVDMMAAFAENALPQRARPPLIEHFAACDRCRGMLSQTIVMNREADATAASTVLSTASAAEVVVPWYQKLFKMPGLAIAMGALVLAFTAMLGYMALQRQTVNNATVSQLEEPELQRGGPSDFVESQMPGADSANSNSAPAAERPATMSNAMSANISSGIVASNSDIAKREDADDLRTAAGRDDGAPLGSIAGKPAEPAVGAGQPLSAPPPPALASTDTISTETANKVGRAADEREKDAEPAGRKELADRGLRDAPAAAAKSGPARSGPFQMKSNQSNNQGYEMSVTRLVGGRTFNNRNGAWYDSAYNGGGTTDVRRGTEEFKKLDGGLRSIANKLGGVIVVVWKNRAYRIQ